MKTKELLFGLGCLLIAACQAEKPVDGIMPDGEGNVEFRVDVPEAMSYTRAGENSSSAKGGLTNVDFTKYDLRYQLAVYRVDGDNMVQAISPQVKIVDSYQSVNYSLRLTPGRQYKVVVWADFVEQGKTEDLHYNTSDLRNVTAMEPAGLNDESRDAYFITKDYKLDEGSVSLLLKRPFAKLRLVTTDWNYENLEMPDNIKVTYFNCKRFTNIDLLTGLSSSAELGAAESEMVYTGSINKAEKDYSLDYDASDNNRTILVDYLMTDISEQTPIHFVLETLDGDVQITRHELNTDIPIQRNWLTTVIGNTLTTETVFEVSIDDKFENEWVVGEEWWKTSGFTPKEPAYDEATKTYHIYTKEEFMWLPDNITNVAGKTISIENDIDMSGVEWKPIYQDVSVSYTVLGNNHTLKNFSMNGKFGAVYEYSALGGFIRWNVNAYTGVWGVFNGVMKDLTFENITINGLADVTVCTDVDGNPIPHDAEAAYFAGCIGYTGANYSTMLNLSNIKARHIHINVSKSEDHVQNIGGLVGWLGVGGGNTWFRDCSVYDANLVGAQTGGLVGQVVGSRYIEFTNCSAEDIVIRKISTFLDSKDVCGFIGLINDAGNGTGGNNVMINKCTTPSNVQYLDFKTNQPKDDYTPDSKYYGSVLKNGQNLIITE